MKNNISEEVYIDVAEELLWITVSKYALFMSHGKIGIDALALYMHYQFTARIQKTNSVWANDKYCRQGLEWGRDRFEKAKNLLIDLDLINIYQSKDSSGKFGKIYIQVKTKKVELEPNDINRLSENPQAGKTASGKTATNALTNKVNALTNKGNANETIQKKMCPFFDEWYNRYDKKVNRSKTEKKWNTLSIDDKKKCLQVVDNYVRSTPDKQFRKHPHTYLNNESWNDEIIIPKDKKNINDPRSIFEKMEQQRIKDASI